MRCPKATLKRYLGSPTSGTWLPPWGTASHAPQAPAAGRSQCRLSACAQNRGPAEAAATPACPVPPMVPPPLLHLFHENQESRQGRVPAYTRKRRMQIWCTWVPAGLQGSSLGGVRDHKVCIVRWEAPGSSATDLHGPPLAWCSHRTAASEYKAQQMTVPYRASLGCIPTGFMPDFMPTDITSQPFERQAANDMVLTGEGYPATFHACPHSAQTAPG